MILQIDDTADEIYFPDPHYGDEDGCFAIGGRYISYEEYMKIMNEE